MRIMILLYVYFILGRSRWVDYAPQYGYEYDGSQVPPEWSVQRYVFDLIGGALLVMLAIVLAAKIELVF